MKIDDLKTKFLHLIPADFYIGVEDGWYNILNCLFIGISFAIKNDYYSGTKISYNKWEDVNPPEYNFRLMQIKEKFGTLRFYYSIDKLQDTVRGMVTIAELMSECTCEYSGDAGSLVDTGGWLKTMSSAKAIEMRIANK